MPKKQLALYYVDHGGYPASQPTVSGNTYCTDDPSYCYKASTGNSILYSPPVGTNLQYYALDASNGSTSYRITNNTSPYISLAVSDPTNWLAIGTQVWAKANLNVGTMVTGVTNQTNNATLEKYCYANTESNCTTYGGFYQWDEAMQYVTTEGAQGVCPTGSHIPSDNDWKILEMQLGMTQAQADAIDWRGTNQGTQLKIGGTSGLNIPLAGYRDTSGDVYFFSAYAKLWSSSGSSTSQWNRSLTSNYVTAARYTGNSKILGFSVRCLGN